MMEYLFKKAREHPGLIISTAVVFTGLCIFFINIHPIIPYDGDDWLYLGLFRYAIPMSRYWDAARVFQDILIPVSGMISAFIVYPFTGDYLFSFAITTAFVISVFASALYISLYQLLVSVINNRKIAVFGCLMMGIFYFGFFKTKYESFYMLHALNYNCVYCYIIPGLLNSILVCKLLCLQVKGVIITPANLGSFKFGVLLVLVYLAIFSMLFGALILAAYCTFYAVLSIIKDRKLILRKNLFHLAVIGLFVIFCLFEITSERAGYDTINTFELNASTGYFERILIAVKSSFTLFRQIDIILFVFSVLSLAAATILLVIKYKKERDSRVAELLLMSLFMTFGIYGVIVIVSAKAGAEFYPQLLQVMHGVFFSYLLSAILSIAYFFYSFEKIRILALFFLVLFTNELFNGDNRYADQMSYHWVEGQLPTSKKMKLTNEMIGIMRDADRENKTEITLYVPKYPNTDDFPHPRSYWGGAFSKTLFVHRVTSRYIKVNLEYADGILPPNSFWVDNNQKDLGSE